MAEVTQSGLEAEQRVFLGAPPPFFSFSYHFHFLPQVVAWRLRGRRPQPQGFQHVHIEIPLLLFGCMLLLVFGLPPALQHGSIGGWISALLGGGGLAALIGWSMLEEWRWRRDERHRYGYAEFMPSVFFFCVLAGGSAGLIAGGVITNEPAMGYFSAMPGLVVGYLVGPIAARWVHGLGFIKTWFIYLAVLGLVLLPVEDLMVLFIYASK